jgi:hydrogenase-4 component H
MRRIRIWLYLLPELWRSLIRGPVTTTYPHTPLELPEGFRGRVAVDADTCRGCGLCVRDCPAFALELERDPEGGFRLVYHPDRCAYCGQCELSCHQGALRLVNEFVSATPHRERLTAVLVERGEDESQEE